MDDRIAKMLVFTGLLLLTAYGGWLPWSFFLVSALVTALAFAIKGST